MSTYCSAFSTSSMRPMWMSSPRARSNRPNTSRFSARCDTRENAGEPLASNRVDVVLGFEHHAERLLDRCGIERLAVQDDNRTDPVQRLRDARHLVELEPAKFLNDGCHLSGEARRRLRHALPHDRQFLLERRIFNPLIQAAALQRVVHL